MLRTGIVAAVAQVVLWCRFSPWPQNFHMLRAQLPPPNVSIICPFQARNQAQETPSHFTCTASNLDELLSEFPTNLLRFLAFKCPFLPSIRMVLCQLYQEGFVGIGFLNKINLYFLEVFDIID